jgi:hypothetical protein
MGVWGVFQGRRDDAEKAARPKQGCAFEFHDLSIFFYSTKYGEDMKREARRGG